MSGGGPKSYRRLKEGTPKTPKKTKHPFTTADILAHFRGETTARKGCGFPSLEGALDAASMLEFVRGRATDLGLACLKEFHEVEAGGELFALAAVYVWVSKERTTENGIKAEDVSKQWKKGESEESKRLTAEAYADSLLKLDREVCGDNGVRFDIEYELSLIERRHRANARRIMQAQSLTELEEAELEEENSGK